MCYYIGLDLSLSGTGAFILDDNGNEIASGLWGQKLKRKSTVREKIERLTYICNNVVNFIKSNVDINSDFCVGIESYAYKKIGAQFDLAELQGNIKVQLWLSLRKIPELIPSTFARKEVLGKGRFSNGKKGKNEIIKAVRERGFDVSDDNIADAYVIAECLRLIKKGDKK